MRKILLTALLMMLCISLSWSQNKIRSGFYLRVGSVFPTGDYAKDNYIKTGGTFEMGSHFYTGPAFFNNRWRIGIDVTYLNFWLNPTEEDNTEYWFWYLGQKAGPIITYNPVNNIRLDFGFRLSPIVGLTGEDTYGRHVNEEFIFNFRYRLLMLSFQYDPGKINYTNFNNEKNMMDNSTFRILIGLKFRN